MYFKEGEAFIAQYPHPVGFPIGPNVGEEVSSMWLYQYPRAPFPIMVYTHLHNAFS